MNEGCVYRERAVEVKRLADCKSKIGIAALGKEKRIDWCDLSRSDYLETFLSYKHFDVTVEITSSPVSFSKC